MRLLLNLLWVVLGGGLLIWLEYVIAGLLLCLTVVGIPFGLQCFKIAGLALWPFGKSVDLQETGSGALRLVFNVLWIVVAGIWICLTQLALAVGLAVTIIGIPFAVQHLKLAALALAPFGSRARL